MGDWTGTIPSVAAGDELPASKVQTGFDVESALSGVWTSVTLTPTTLVFGNAVVISRYRRVGKTVDLRFKVTMGTTTTYGATYWTFTVPAGLAALDTGMSGAGMIFDNGVGQRAATVYFNTTVDLIVCSSSANVAGPANPFTWSTGDSLQFAITYETA